MSTVTIYKLSIWLDTKNIRMSKRVLTAKETNKSYSVGRQRIDKSKINEIQSNLIDSHCYFGYYAYCLPENEAQVIIALKRKVTERVITCKKEIDAVLVQLEKIEDVPITDANEPIEIDIEEIKRVLNQSE